MSELTMEWLRTNLESLKMKHTLEILDNYLERAVKDELNIVEVLGHIFSEEATAKRHRAYDKQIQMSGFPIKLVAARHRFSTYYTNCHTLIEQLKKAHFENRLPDKFKTPSKYKLLIIDEIGYLPMDIQGANLFF